MEGFLVMRRQKFWVTNSRETQSYGWGKTQLRAGFKSKVQYHFQWYWGFLKNVNAFDQFGDAGNSQWLGFRLNVVKHRWFVLNQPTENSVSNEQISKAIWS